MKMLFLTISCMAWVPVLAQQVPPPRFFPLDEGSVWSYESDLFGGLVVNRVNGIDSSGVVEFDRNGRQRVRLRDRQSEIDIEIGDTGFQPFYRFGENQEPWIRRDVADCNDNRRAVIGSRNETVTTPAGTFEGCIRIDYGGGICQDAGISSEWFAPEVGIVQWQEPQFAGLVTFSLIDFQRGEGTRFIRGEVNGSATREIGDAIFILTFLFLGGPPPTCLKAGDVNDDTGLDLSDAVYLLNFLFLGGPSPDAPFPGCGTDPTPDDVTCESFEGCPDVPN